MLCYSHTNKTDKSSKNSGLKVNGGLMKVYFAILACLLSLTACSDQQISTTYLCDKHTVKLIAINQKNAELTFNNHTYLLNRERSASGNKYINEDVLFWGKGNNAMLIIAGKKYQCVTE